MFVTITDPSKFGVLVGVFLVVVVVVWDGVFFVVVAITLAIRAGMDKQLYQLFYRTVHNP